MFPRVATLVALCVSLLGVHADATHVPSRTAETQTAARPYPTYPQLRLEPASVYLSLLRHTRAQDAPPREVTLEQMHRVTPHALVSIFDWLHTERLPAVYEGERDQILSEPQVEFILETLTALGRHRVLGAADAWLQGREGASERRAVLVAGRAVTDSRDLGRLVLLAEPKAGGELDESLARQFELNLRAMFQRDPSALPTVVATRSLVPTPLLAALARALGTSRDERALEGLALIWDRDPELAPLVLAQIRQLPAPRDEATTEGFANRLRRALDRLDPGPPVRIQALVFALGQLEDWRSVELMVALLEHPDRGVRGAALWALQRISGFSFGSDAGHWREWCERELSWFQDRASQLMEHLGSGEAERASLALRELVGHRLFRHPLAAMLEGLLDSGDKNARVAACQALAQLGSQRAQRALAQRLEDRDVAVRDAAWQALVALTGRELPRTRLDCLAELFPAAPKF